MASVASGSDLPADGPRWMQAVVYSCGACGFVGKAAASDRVHCPGCARELAVHQYMDRDAAVKAALAIARLCEDARSNGAAVLMRADVEKALRGGS